MKRCRGPEENGTFDKWVAKCQFIMRRIQGSFYVDAEMMVKAWEKGEGSRYRRTSEPMHEINHLIVHELY